MISDELMVLPLYPEQRDKNLSKAVEELIKISQFYESIDIDEWLIERREKYHEQTQPNITETVFDLSGLNIGHSIIKLYEDHWTYPTPYRAIEIDGSVAFSFDPPHMDENYAIHIDENYELIWEQIQTILFSLSGNEIETGRIDSDSEPFSNWRWYNGHGSDKTYEEHIHPVVVKTIEVILKKETPGSYVPILDLFSADNRFIVSLHNRLSYSCPNFEFSYHCADKEDVLLEKAAKDLGDRDLTGRGSGKYGNITWRREDLRTYDFGFPEISEAPKIITAIGGLTNSVTTNDEAYEIAVKAHSILAPSGYFIVTGLSNCHLNSQDFADIGFNVLNKSVPERISRTDNRDPQQLYILQKID